MSGSSALSKSVPVNSHPSSPSEVDPSEKRRGRAPLNYTDEFETPSSILLNAIGVVRSPYKVSAYQLLFHTYSDRIQALLIQVSARMSTILYRARMVYTQV